MNGYNNACLTVRELRDILYEAVFGETLSDIWKKEPYNKAMARFNKRRANGEFGIEPSSAYGMAFGDFGDDDFGEPSSEVPGSAPVFDEERCEAEKQKAFQECWRRNDQAHRARVYLALALGALDGLSGDDDSLEVLTHYLKLDRGVHQIDAEKLDKLIKRLKSFHRAVEEYANYNGAGAKQEAGDGDGFPE